MAIYKPDYKFKKAKELINSLDDTEENELIKYYIKKKQDRIDELNNRLNEHNDFFEKLDRFLPNRNPIIR